MIFPPVPFFFFNQILCHKPFKNSSLKFSSFQNTVLSKYIPSNTFFQVRFFQMHSFKKQFFRMPLIKNGSFKNVPSTTAFEHNISDFRPFCK